MDTCTGSATCLGVTIAPNKEFIKSNAYQVELYSIMAGLTPLLIIFQCTAWWAGRYLSPDMGNQH